MLNKLLSIVGNRIRIMKELAVKNRRSLKAWILRSETAFLFRVQTKPYINGVLFDKIGANYHFNIAGDQFYLYTIFNTPLSALKLEPLVAIESGLER